MAENTEDKLWGAVEQKIRGLAGQLDLSLQQLSLAIGLSANTIPNYLTKQRIPSAVACLLLAGKSKKPADREFWIDISKKTLDNPLTDDQVALICSAFQPELPTDDEMRDVRSFLSFPHTGEDKLFADLVKMKARNRRG